MVSSQWIMIVNNICSFEASEIYMQVKKQQLELDMEQQIGSKLGKEYVKAALSSCLFNLYAEYIMQHAWLDEAQARIKIAGRNINNQICR